MCAFCTVDSMLYRTRAAAAAVTLTGTESKLSGVSATVSVRMPMTSALAPVALAAGATHASLGGTETGQCTVHPSMKDRR